MPILTERRRVDLNRLEPERLLAALRQHDLRGHGGAAFPTATKISSARGRRPRLIINACDGEPLVGKDAVLLDRVPHLVADGAAVVARLVEAREVLIAVHGGSRSERAARRLVEQDLPGARVLPVPSRYVSSEASALASLAAGGEAKPVTRWQPLTQEGPGRNEVPVLVLNAETVARAAALWLHTASGDHRQLAPTRLITVSGVVARPGVLEVGLDATIGDVAGWAGGPTAAPRAVLLGGYGGSWIDWPDAERTPLAAFGADLGAGLVHVQGTDCPVRFVGKILTFLAGESAGQCGPCMFGLPAIAADWAELSVPGRGPAAWDRLSRRLPIIEGRGACKHPDGAVRQVVTAARVFGPHIADHWRGTCTSPGQERAA